MKTLIRFIILSIILPGWLAGCASGSRIIDDSPQGLPPALVLGEFEDDYGIRYTISRNEWRQHPKTKYKIVIWRPDKQYLIAQNDAANIAAPGLWTRIDWVKLPGMPPYEWAFCMSAYDAPSAAEAEQSDIANRETPKTGCNGHPFSRMKSLNGTDNPDQSGR